MPNSALPESGIPPDPPWLSHLPPSPADGNLGPLQLAWLGDAVWELHQRLRHCQRAGRSDQLHRAVVAKVKAEAEDAKRAAARAKRAASRKRVA